MTNKEQAPVLLILAAGMGSRYGGLKQADQVGPSGETIIDYSIYDAIRAGFGKVVMVVRQNILTEMRALFDNRWGHQIDIEYAIQEVNVPVEGIDNLPERQKPWGTAHAVMVAEGVKDRPFAVINADDFYGAEAFATISDFLQNQAAPNHYAMVGYILQNTLSESGHVSRGLCTADDNGYLATIVEHTHIQRLDDGRIVNTYSDGRQVVLDENSYVSMNFWGLHPAFFAEARQQFKDFVAANRHNEKAEFYIPLVIDTLIKAGKIKVEILSCAAHWMGVTYREDKPVVERMLRKLVAEGQYPENLFE